MFWLLSCNPIVRAASNTLMQLTYLVHSVSRICLLISAQVISTSFWLRISWTRSIWVTPGVQFQGGDRIVRMRKHPYRGNVMEILHLIVVEPGFEISLDLGIKAVDVAQANRCLKGKVLGNDELMQGETTGKDVVIAIVYDTVSNGPAYFVFDANRCATSAARSAPSSPHSSLTPAQVACIAVVARSKLPFRPSTKEEKADLMATTINGVPYADALLVAKCLIAGHTESMLNAKLGGSGDYTHFNLQKLTEMEVRKLSSADKKNGMLHALNVPLADSKADLFAVQDRQFDEKRGTKLADESDTAPRQYTLRPAALVAGNTIKRKGDLDVAKAKKEKVPDGHECGQVLLLHCSTGVSTEI